MSVTGSNLCKLSLVSFLLFLLSFTPGCGRGLVAGPLQPAGPPSIGSFSAAATSLTAGQSTTLNWATTGATTVAIDNGVGTVAASGSATVSPTQTTTYTLTATGSGGSSSAHVTVTVNQPKPTVTITADPTGVSPGQSSTLTVTATNASGVGVVCSDSNGTQEFTGTLPGTGGTLSVTPKNTVTCIATAKGADNQTATASVQVTVKDVHQINHVIFLMQENRSFDNYFGMLNPYRKSHGFEIGDDGKQYDVDGIEDKLNKFPNPDDEGDNFNLFKLSTTCVDDLSSAWLESYGDVNRFDFAPSRSILMNGFVHIAEGFAKSGAGTGKFTDLKGRRAMGYYDQDFLNYYYFMASEFALSDRWFSPVASKTIPNRLATMTGGTTQGLVRDPSNDDHVGGLSIETIFQKLDNAGVSWKIYYSVTADECPADTDECQSSHPDKFPATSFSYFNYSAKYLYDNPTHAACNAPTQQSGQAVGDPNNDFCIDPNHIAPLSQFLTDMSNGTLPAFAYIEPGYGISDEHPGSGASILVGQQEMAKLINAFMASPSWNDSVFFLSYDEGGGPFDHVPPVPGHTNDYTDATLGVTTDISSIAVNPDQFKPCLGGPGNLHCDLQSTDPGANPGDAPAQQGFAAQLGFRLPNIVISPFTKKHYVAHTPMDHTAIIKFVEDRFINDGNYLTARDAAQPNLNEFFDFVNVPWKTPPSPPTPASPGACHPADLGP